MPSGKAAAHKRTGPGRRAIKLTEAQVIELERMAKIGLNKMQVALIFACSIDMLDSRFKDQEGVREAWERGKAMAADTVLGILWEMIVEDRNPAAIFFYCKTQLGMRETNRVEVSGSISIEQAIKEAAGEVGANDDAAEPE